MLTFRKATKQDLMLVFDWANDEVVRLQSYNNTLISLENHTKWFNNKIEDENCIMLIFINEAHKPIGQVRLEIDDKNCAVIGVVVGQQYRGKGYASQILLISSNYFLKQQPTKTIYAYIKKENVASIKSFAKANFDFLKDVDIEGTPSVLFTKQKKNANS